MVTVILQQGRLLLPGLLHHRHCSSRTQGRVTEEFHFQSQASNYYMTAHQLRFITRTRTVLEEPLLHVYFPLLAPKQS